MILLHDEGCDEKLNFAGKSDKGLVRRTNQDCFAVERLSDDAVFAVVCDGMGGANGGNVASELAVETFCEKVKGAWRSGMPQRSVYNLLKSSATAANITVFDKAKSDDALSGMGTTVVAATVCGGMAYIIHAGDSRAYKFGKDGLVQITRDHSVVQAMVESGKLTKEAARVHPRKNVITRALGVDENLNVEYAEVEIDEGEGLLLCSDGLTNFVSDEQIAEIIEKTPLCDCPQSFVELANKNGGGDNITAVMVLNEKGEEQNG